MFIGDHEKNFVLESVELNGTRFGERMISRKGDHEIRGADGMFFETFGFGFEGESPLLANPKDPRTTDVFDRSIRGNTDQFILKFRKPAA